MSASSPSPRISIVIPVYNEEAILRSAIVDLRERLAPLRWHYEVILAENGSRDKTAELSRALCDKYPELRALSAGEPNYGKALREGIRAARGEFVLCDEIDLCDTDFHQAAVAELELGATDLVIGSKLIAGARDPLADSVHVFLDRLVFVDAVEPGDLVVVAARLLDLALLRGQHHVAAAGGGVAGAGRQQHCNQGQRGQPGEAAGQGGTASHGGIL